MKFTVDKGIPIPTAPQRRPLIYPFANMEVGDSFTVSIDEGDSPVSARCAAGHHKRRNPGWDYCARKIAPGVVRIWRIR